LAGVKGLAQGVGRLQARGWGNQQATGQQLHIQGGQFWNFALADRLIASLPQAVEAEHPILPKPNLRNMQGSIEIDLTDATAGENNLKD
jgi:hypothetical protein